MTKYPRGSEWCKWDLHVHAPGTKLNNGYGQPSKEVWDQYCRTLEESDVVVFGITDYYSCDSYFEFVRQHRERYPGSGKVFLPNIEMRLNESVNKDGQHVNVHLLFRPDLPETKIRGFLAVLHTETTDPRGRPLKAAELSTTAQFCSTTVSKAELRKALRAEFGDPPWTDDLLILVPAGNDGIRPASGKLRSLTAACEIDKFADALFGNARDVPHYLKRDRHANQEIPAKPVFAGCDAHDFRALDTALGKDVNDPSQRSEVTWIKADPTFAGLQQTLYEPEHRVRIQPTQPDAKEPYMRIAKVRFSGTDYFPQEIEFNQNLVSIIGSRSAGKSALLAYIAHAIDDEYTIRQQMAAQDSRQRDKMGPAAGLRWSEVDHINCDVEWGDPAAQSGKVIYIPQNSLFEISGRPEEITDKIELALYRRDPSFRAAYATKKSAVSSANAEIRSAVEEWFRLRDEQKAVARELRELGDKNAITATRDTIAARIEELRALSSLTPEETAAYEAVMDRLGDIRQRRTTIEEEARTIAPYVVSSDDDGYQASSNVTVTIETTPTPSSMPDALRAKLATLVAQAQQDVAVRLKAEICTYRKELDAETESLGTTDSQIEADNRALIDKHKANVELENEVVKHRKQEEALRAIAAKEQEMQALAEARSAQITALTSAINKRQQAQETLEAEFARIPSANEDGLSFGLEFDYADDTLRALAQPFNIRVNSDYLDRNAQTLRIDKVHENPADFLADLETGAQRLKAGHQPVAAAVNVLTATPAVRFSATLEGDRIGGFDTSSMTPGKQARFALTLILDESDDQWPLLIDQPEDDLDSRSVYDKIVPYLVQKKTERQIIMVTHNANLVIGADSEQVIVANRHGADRPNRDDRMFDYLTGSLEHSTHQTTSRFALENGGIRQHACTILDGGEDAFQKRKEKYKIP